MSESFDAYHRWLGIPAKEQPPHHYRLLGVELFEADPHVIDAMATRHMAYLQDITDGPLVKEAQRLLNELAAARRCLLNAETKAAYDAELRDRLAPTPPPAPTAPMIAPMVVSDEKAKEPRVREVAMPAHRETVDGQRRAADERSRRATLILGTICVALLAVAVVWWFFRPGRSQGRLEIVRPDAFPKKPASPVPAPVAPPPAAKTPTTPETPAVVDVAETVPAPALVDPLPEPAVAAEALPDPPGPPPISQERLLLWLDAAEAATLDVDAEGRLRRWLDRSPHGSSAEPDAAEQRPQLAQDVLQGRPVVRFAGAAALAVPGKSDLFHLDSEYTLSFVARGEEGTLLSKGSGASEGSFVLSHGGTCLRAGGEDRSATGGDSSVFHVRSVVADAQSLRWYVAGQPCGDYADGKHAVRNTSRLRLGCVLARGQGGTSFFRGDVAELVLYGRALPDADREAVEAYLRQKWLNGDEPPAAPIAMPDANEVAADPAPVTPAESPPVAEPSGFVPLVPRDFSSTAGATLRPRDDGAAVIEGGSNANDTYEFVAETGLPRITAILLEVLPDESLPGKGPGRGQAGVFSVAEFSVRVPTVADAAQLEAVRFSQAVATVTGGAERMIDGQANTSWTVRRRGERVGMLFVLGSPRDVPPPAALHFTLVQRDTLGCFRVFATAADDPQALFRTRQSSGPGETEAGFTLFVNVGGEAWVDADGNRWEAGRPFDGTGFGHEGGQAVKTEAVDDPVVRTAQRGLAAFRAVVPNGNYEVALYFSEHWVTRPERRTFVVLVEQQPVLAPVNVFQGPGLGAPYVHRVPRVVVRDGRLDVDFAPANADSNTILNGIRIRQVR